MRVSALSPQVVHETPEDPGGDSARVLSLTAERRRAVGATSTGRAVGDALSEETKAGLRRLSSLLREKPKEGDGERGGRHGHPAAPEDLRDPPGGGPAPGSSRFIYMSAFERGLRGYVRARATAGSLETAGRFLDLVV